MLFDATGSMIYGENPASWETGDLMDPKASSINSLAKALLIFDTLPLQIDRLALDRG